jgi:type I restriction enzyme S subunit
MFGDPKKNPNAVSFETAFTIRDDLRKPINDAVRSEMHTGERYPYYGANGQVDSINEYLMDCDAICLAEDCGSYGAGEATSYIVSGKCWVNNHAHVLIPKDCCDIEFANVYFRILDMSEYVTGTTRLKLTQAKMKMLPMILPPMDQQKQFAAFVRQSDKSKLLIKDNYKKINQDRRLLTCLMKTTRLSK